MGPGEEDEDDSVGETVFENWSLKALGSEESEGLGKVPGPDEEEGGGRVLVLGVRVPRTGGSSDGIRAKSDSMYGISLLVSQHMRLNSARRPGTITMLHRS